MLSEIESNIPIYIFIFFWEFDGNPIHKVSCIWIFCLPIHTEWIVFTDFSFNYLDSFTDIVRITASFCEWYDICIRTKSLSREILYSLAIDNSIWYIYQLPCLIGDLCIIQCYLFYDSFIMILGSTDPYSFSYIKYSSEQE